MAAQMNYGYDIPKGVPGGKFDLSDDHVVTRLNDEDDGVMGFGLAVVIGQDAGTTVKLPVADSTKNDFEGIVLHHANTEQDMNGKACSILTYACDIPRCNTIVCGTYPHRASLGTIRTVIQETAAGVTVTAYSNAPSGTVRIGGRKWDATLGELENTAVTAGKEMTVEIPDMVSAGQESITGTYPSASSEGILLAEENVKNTEKISVSETDLPAAGRLASGGGEPAEPLYTGITYPAETEPVLAVALPETKSASADSICGSGGKTVEETETVETEAAVTAAAVTVRRCGSGSAVCGRN